jgi:hypothetical protein
MVAGTLAQSGYFMGDQLIPARDGNPKGFFEDVKINRINEELLAQVLPKRPRFLGRYVFKDRPLYGQRWLAKVPVGTTIPSNQHLTDQIKRLVKNEPFCFKDPRLCYTLPVWKSHLKNVVFICVFRDPISTINSIMKEVKYEPHLHHFNINSRQALEIWMLMYQHILQLHKSEGEWLFLHYNQVLSGEGLEKLAKFTGASVDYSFPEISLQRSQPNCSISQNAKVIYQQLCNLSGYTEVVPISI